MKQLIIILLCFVSVSAFAQTQIDSGQIRRLPIAKLVTPTTPTNGQVIKYNSTSGKWEPGTDNNSGGSPGGSNTQLQFNSSGSFSGSANATFDGTGIFTKKYTSLLDTTISGKLIFPSLEAATGNAGIWYEGVRLLDRQTRRNEVISLGFNWDNSAVGDNSNIRLGIERHYMPFVGAGYYWQEFHAPEVRLTDGTIYRPASWEGRKDIKSGVWTYRSDSYNMLASDDTEILSFAKAGGFKSVANSTSSATWTFLNAQATKQISWNIGADGTVNVNGTTGNIFNFQKPININTGISGAGLSVLSNQTGSNALSVTGTVTGSSTPLDLSVSASTGLQGLLYNTSTATNAKSTITVLASGSNADASMFFGNTAIEYWSFGLDATDGHVKINSNASDPSSGTNHFLITNTGKVGIGNVSSPTARLHLKESSTSTASLRIPTGTAPTSPNEGDIWQTSNDLHFYTNSTDAILARVLKGSATLDFGSTAAGATSTLTVTVTGASTTDSGVSFNYQNTDITGVYYSAKITSSNTVTITCTNLSGSSVDPSSGTCYVTVIK